jgi:chemotaxis protein MotB
MILAKTSLGDPSKVDPGRERMFQRAHQIKQDRTDDFCSLSQDPLVNKESRDLLLSNDRYSVKGAPPPNPEEALFHDYPGHGGDGHLFGRKMPKPIHWSIPWSDLMMTMFIFFAIMFTYHAALKEVPSNERPSNQTQHSMVVPNRDKDSFGMGGETFRHMYDLTKDTLSHESLRSFASVDLVPDKAVRIILTGDLLFDTGMASLKGSAKNSLKEIAEILRKTPYMINLVGHTDDRPIQTEQFPSNWELSTTRACKVARFLIDEMHIPAEKFYISGHASYQPLKPNDGGKDRAVNRRVEIIVTKERPYTVNGGLMDPLPLASNL